MVKLNGLETETVLKALRVYQRDGEDLCLSDRVDDLIDQICEKINFDDDSEETEPIRAPSNPIEAFGLGLCRQLKDLDVQMKHAGGTVKGLVDRVLGELPGLSDDEFWEQLADLKEEWERVKDSGDSRLAIERFLWKFFHGGKNDPVLAVRFVKTYRSKVEALGLSLNTVITGCGSDTFGDVIDSFPLFGHDMYEQAVRGKLIDKDDYRVWYQGENYFRTFLRDELCEKMRGAAGRWLEG